MSVAEPDKVAQPFAVAPASRERLATVKRTRRAAGRGSVVLRGLRVADVAGLSVAFLVATIFVADASGQRTSQLLELGLFVLTLPIWVALASLYGLYSRDEIGADHSTADEVFGVVNLVTVGTWFVFAAASITGYSGADLGPVITFWIVAIIAIVGARALVRSFARADDAYLQRALILGAGDVGQLVARKIAQHPEYAIELVGFVDDDPRQARADVKIDILGGVDALPRLVEEHDVDRVIVAFRSEPDARTLALVRLLPLDDVIVDVVPRLFELVGPRATLHSIEGMPLVSLPPSHLSRSALATKRALDVVGAIFALILTAPLFAYIAVRIRLDSKGPVFFRQTRLGYGMRPFTVLKFRTMAADTDDATHREYIRSTMSSSAELGASKVYKLERPDDVTSFGRWLRKTSLDELPQLVNVLRGEMSLVGPRPCIPYETENFEPHQFERFLVPQGITGLWQVAARSNSTFGEALEMDVAYARGWSLGFDLRLLFRTPFAILRQRRATA
jgi:exopolysaccharide biosynthesis polyprenyl glycosylphosphotransferase